MTTHPKGRTLTRSTRTFALGLGTGLATYAAVSAGLVGGLVGGVVGGGNRVVDVVGSVLTPPAAAGQLPAFESCERLRQWYVSTALPRVGPWGLDGPPVMYAMDAQSAAGPDRAVASSATGTNVQEADVDESDVAKTDGRLVVRISGSDLVVTDVSGAATRELSRTPMPGPASADAELVLSRGHVVVVGSTVRRYGGGPIFDRGGIGPGRSDPGLIPSPEQEPRTMVVGYDLADPSAPRLTDSRSFDGEVLSTRLHDDGTVHIALRTEHPSLDFVQPNRARSAAQAARLNREVVRRAPLDAWLPATRSETGARQPLLDCSEVRHPTRPSGFGTLSVIGFPVSAPDSFTASAVVASGDLVYSSARRLYVGTTTAQRTTTLHAFALDGERTTYVASGSVPGTVKDRWSLSEHDGRLRVATALGDAWAPRENAVVVLAERDGRLAETGRVEGLGRGETIRAVRWFGDLAVVVTFQQTDPLYTVDLSDARRPRLVGVLKVPGFSAYLHPVGDDVLVGLGRDATGAGDDLGAQAATFDLRDLAHVQRVDTVRFGEHTELGAATDPRAFTYLPGRRTVLTTVQSWDTGRTGYAALRVGRDGSLVRVGSWSADRSGQGMRALPLPGDRVALVGDGVRVVDVP